MSCPNASSPIDITSNAGTCKLKCDYSFRYMNTNLVGRNGGDYLSFRPSGNDKAPPVVFNADKFVVKEMRLYQPSLHTYGGNKADAELIIEHSNVTGSGDLMVCIPVTKGMTAGGAATVLDDLVSQVAQFAPTAGGNAGEIRLATFTFGKLVPTKPFYSYKGSLPYSPCTGSYNYVVFDKDNAVPMSMTTYAKMLKVVSANSYTTHSPLNGLYKNSSGPAPFTGEGDDIYIECKPTGHDGETLVTEPKPGSSMFSGETAQDILNSPILHAFLGVLVMLGLLKIAHVLFTKIGGAAKSARQLGKEAANSASSGT